MMRPELMLWAEPPPLRCSKGGMSMNHFRSMHSTIQAGTPQCPNNFCTSRA